MDALVRKVELPKRTYFGPGSMEGLKEHVEFLNARRVFIISDRSVANAGLVERLVNVIGKRRRRVEVFDRTEPEPTVQSVESATEAMRNAGGIDLLISLGGGSVIDTAKSANIVVNNGGSILDYEEGSKKRRSLDKILPHIAIPTTAGTGSEATVWAIFIDQKRKFKTGVQDPRLIPDLVILDPEVTTTMPQHVTAATGMDALTHAIESYVSDHANPFTEALSIESIELIANNLRIAYKDGKNIEARGNMLLASYMAGIAFSNSSCGIVHTLAETLGGYYRIPHGVTNSLMLPGVMEFNANSRREKFSKIAGLMGEIVENPGTHAGALKSVDAVRRLASDLELPMKLREVGVSRKDIPTLATMAFPWANISGNPRKATLRQLRKLYVETF
jgi:alcohol dehydrogenase class IV